MTEPGLSPSGNPTAGRTCQLQGTLLESPMLKIPTPRISAARLPGFQSCRQLGRSEAIGVEPLFPPHLTRLPSSNTVSLPCW